ncbi:MAG: restriction endonuclease subunit S [Microbacteriaceae bacterium]|nr:MAG: restriction endonuclease subunit S [Microbacteriaceae bacterium]
MPEWEIRPLSDVVQLQRGHDLPSSDRRDGDVPIIGSFGITGFHDVARYRGPGVGIGRSGASIGKATYVADDYWPLNTCLFVSDFKRNDPRWVYRFLDRIDFQAFNSGSAQPSLNRNFLRMIPVAVPSLAEQQAIAEVLGALDDKIAANTAVAYKAEELASLVYDLVTASWPRVPLSELLDPVLGGTPSRSREDYWADGADLWISARDITSAPMHVLLDTAEKITESAITTTKAKPLPTGSVILTARGTVGEVARLVRPASFNQSCYGFRPERIPPSLLFFSILCATERAKAIAHGSVFDTITKSTFDDLSLAWDSESADHAESAIAPLLDAVTGAIEENRTLAATRDALLPQLMSGKLRVRNLDDLRSEENNHE